mgnify:CR=1 FL=1
MTMKISSVLSVALLCLFLVRCSPPQDEQLKNDNRKADSLSAALNSPELKAVNAELLKNPDNADLYFKRAGVYQTLKLFNEAVNDSKRAIRMDSTKAPYYLGLADIYFSMNNTRYAKELLEISAKKFPDNVEALLKLAELYFLVKQYQKGIDFANKALKLDENLAKAYYLKGSIYRESGDTAKAISSLETAIEQDNRFEDAFYDLGVLYAARKNPLALEYYNNALRINASSLNALYARAKYLQDMGKFDEAMTEYAATVKMHGDCENCYYNMGAVTLEIKKDAQKALEYFGKAIELNPTYLEAYLARGYAYSKLKDKASARADYNMCLKLQPNYDPAIQALNEL